MYYTTGRGPSDSRRGTPPVRNYYLYTCSDRVGANNPVAVDDVDRWDTVAESGRREMGPRKVPDSA